MELAELRIPLVDAHDDKVAIHRPFHQLAVDVDVGILGAAEDGAVAVGMHLHGAGVVRRELQERVALAAHRDQHAVALELLDDDRHLVARDLGVSETLVDLADCQKAVTALAKEPDDIVFELRVAHGERASARW